MPRLLVISHHYPPDGAVGGLRWSGMAKYLARRGWEVHVVTAASQDGQRPTPGVTVHYAATATTVNDLYNSFARGFRTFRERVRRRRAIPASSEPSAPKTVQQADSAGVLSRIRDQIAVSLSFPDYARGWMWPSFRTTRALLHDLTFDAIISTSPPHSQHIAATLALLDNPQLLWIDMRDPWVPPDDTAWLETTNDTAMSRWLVRKVERLVFERARGVITNTPEFAQDVRSRYPGLRVAYVPNGVDPERLPARSKSKYDGLSIAYAGTLYLARDLSPVVRGMSAFFERHPEARASVKLRVAGDMSETLATRFYNAVAETGLEDNIEVRGRVTAAEAMELINRSHLSLVLAQEQPAQVPAKLYECVAMGVQTLVIGETHSAAASAARRIGAAALEASDIDGISRLIERIWSSGGTEIVPLTPIGYDVIAVQMDALLRGNDVRVVDTAADASPSR